jgi:preprotein translocase subunit SecF
MADESMNYRFLGKKKTLWLAISTVIIIPSVIALSVWKLPLGIDFRGGAQFELKFDKTPTEEELKQKIANYPEARGVTVTKADGESFIIRVLPISEGEYKAISKKLESDFGQYTEKQFQSVGPAVSKDLTRKAILAVAIATLLIIVYLAYSFRGVSRPVSSWRFGLVAALALLHDLLISIGVFAVLAHYFNYEVDSSFITAMLTIMGFSVHDTIVVFDRIRENMTKNRVANALEFEKIADESLSETLNRSIATSLTVIFTLSALAILGGESIRGFVLTLLVGISIGTYSSLFTATPLLVLWQNRVFNKQNQQN